MTGEASNESLGTRSATIAYQPALDGVRALAVLAVLFFHGEVVGFGGGYLGVSVFFTLSGFLITSLLAAETATTGSVALGAFYSRRARRLLPASILLIVVVMVASATTDWFDGVADLRAHVVGSLLQVANWVFLGSGGSYQELLQQAAGAASPLEHYWSLAIEEQFYWIWPLAFVALWRLGRSHRGRLILLGTVTAVFVVAAPVIAAMWGSDAAYWASPARAAEILLGAFLALAVAGRRLPARLWVLAPVAMVALAVCIVTFPAAGGPAYSGWLPAIGAISALLLLGLQVESPVRDALSVAPLVWLGRISYGVYLFHWPIFVVMNPERVGVDGPALFALRMATTLVVAQVSFTCFEQPVRRAGGLGIRRTVFAAAGTTAVVVLAAVLVIPSADSDYWSTADDVAAAAALDTDDAPLVAAAPPTGPSVPGTFGPGPSVPGTFGPGPSVPGTFGPDATRPASSTGTAEVTATTITASATTAATSPTSASPTTTEATTTDATTSTLPPIPVLSRPVRMIVAGDSTGEAFGNGVVGWAAAHPDLAQAELSVERGCGFVRGGEYLLDGDWYAVRDDCTDWLENGLVQRVATARPDVVLMVTTSWDVLDHRWDDGAGFATDTAEMRSRLTADFSEVTDELLAAGAGSVVWVKAPIPNPLWFSRGTEQERPARHDVLHAVMDDVAAQHPGQVYTCDLLGWFDEAGLTNDHDLRPDGVHVTPEAARLVAEGFLGEQMMRAALHLF